MVENQNSHKQKYELTLVTFLYFRNASRRTKKGIQTKYHFQRFRQQTN